MFEYLDFIANWFNNGIYSWYEEAIAYFVSNMVILWFKLQLEALRFAWSIAQTVISNLGISTAISNAWAALPADISNTANFFKVPQAFNILISAGVTRLVMSFIPGI